MTRAVGVSAGLVAALIVGGCLDFEPVTAPGQPESVPVTVRVDARFSEGPLWAPPAPVAVLVQLIPGRDEQGARPVLGDTLWVDDEPIVPTEVGREGERWYLYEGSASEAADLRLRFPRLGRVESGPPELRIHRPSPFVADTLRVTPGQELVIPLPGVAADETSGSTASHMWSLQIRGAAGHFDVASAGQPPATLTVPPAIRPEPQPDGTLRADFSYWIDRRPVAERDLKVNVSQWVRLGWIIEVVGPPEPGGTP